MCNLAGKSCNDIGFTTVNIKGKKQLRYSIYVVRRRKVLNEYRVMEKYTHGTITVDCFGGVIKCPGKGMFASNPNADWIPNPSINSVTQISNDKALTYYAIFPGKQKQMSVLCGRIRQINGEPKYDVYWNYNIVVNNKKINYDDDIQASSGRDIKCSKNDTKPFMVVAFTPAKLWKGPTKDRPTQYSKIDITTGQLYPGEILFIFSDDLDKNPNSLYSPPMCIRKVVGDKSSVEENAVSLEELPTVQNEVHLEEVVEEQPVTYLEEIPTEKSATYLEEILTEQPVTYLEEIITEQPVTYLEEIPVETTTEKVVETVIKKVEQKFVTVSSDDLTITIPKKILTTKKPKNHQVFARPPKNYNKPIDFSKYILINNDDGFGKAEITTTTIAGEACPLFQIRISNYTKNVSEVCETDPPINDKSIEFGFIKTSNKAPFNYDPSSNFTQTLILSKENIGFYKCAAKWNGKLVDPSKFEMVQRFEVHDK
uniref:Ig-like domain-containing protein n=1 Tax=Parastrongyloides trichosuri TaxID=131310 RepID=A0A0N5A2P0_PARTI